MVRYYDLNKPIPELNNLSLTQVFEDGKNIYSSDFNSNSPLSFGLDSTNTTTYNGFLNMTTTGTTANPYGYSPVLFNTTDVLYVRTRARVLFSGSLRISISFNSGVQVNYNNPIINIWNDFSMLGNAPIGRISVSFNQPSLTAGNVAQYDYLYIYNLTSLGIDLTKEQMDYWFSIYQDSKGAVGSAFVQHAGIDTVIPNLNNKTLREVFEDGNEITNHDFSDGTNGWNSLHSTSLVLNNILTNTGSGTTFYPTLLQTNKSVIGDTFYSRAKMRVTNNLSTEIKIWSGSQGISIYNPVINQWYEISGIKTPVSLNFELNHRYSSNSNANGANMEVDGNYGVYHINLTALGIDTLTQAEMDYYFSLYQSWKQKTLYIGKSKNLLLPSENETLTQNGVTLTNLGNNRYLINGTPSTSTRIGIDNGLNYQTSFFNMLANGYKKDININNDYVTSYKYISGSKTGSVSAIAVHSVNKDNTTQYIRTSNVILTTSDNSDFENSPTYDTLVTYLYLESGETFTNYIIDIQLEQRTFATNYEQYYTPKTWIAPAFQQHAMTDTKLIDTKLACLNGYSIREVFESNLAQGVNWSGNSNTTVQVDGTNVKGFGDGTGSEIRISQSYNISSNQKIYINNYYNSNVPIPATYLGRYVLSNNSNNSFAGTYTFAQYTTLINQFSNIYTIPSTQYISRLDFNVIKSNIPSNQFVEVDDLYLLNLTALGIDHLTQAELDQMFALYQDRNKNLFDGEWAIGGYDTNGQVISSTDFKNIRNKTRYIPIKENTQYTIKGDFDYEQVRVWFYNSNKNYISLATVYGSSGLTFTTPTNTSYIDFRFFNSIEYTNPLTQYTAQLELGTTATPYHAYGGFSLKDVFETGNLVTNGDFSDGTTGWISFNSTLSVTDGVMSITSGDSYTYSLLRQLGFSLNASNIYYQRLSMKALDDITELKIERPMGLTIFNPQINKWYDLISLGNPFYLDEVRINNNNNPAQANYVALVDNVFLLDLTTLNIADLTKDFMDDLYGAYSKTYQAPAFIDKYGVLNAPSFQVTAGLDTAFADLNGLTLREVFEDGNLLANGGPNFTDTTSWSGAEVTGVNNGNLVLVGNGAITTVRTFSSFVGNLSDVYYYNAKVRTLDDNATQIRVYDGYTLGALNNPIQNQWYQISYVRNSVQLLRMYIDTVYTSTNESLGATTEINYAQVINLTALGINLTKEQMDWYFELYKTYKGGM